MSLVGVHSSAACSAHVEHGWHGSVALLTEENVTSVMGRDTRAEVRDNRAAYPLMLPGTHGSAWRKPIQAVASPWGNDSGKTRPGAISHYWSTVAQQSYPALRHYETLH